jgi:hypothetical protein
MDSDDEMMMKLLMEEEVNANANEDKYFIFLDALEHYKRKRTVCPTADV